MSLPDLTFSGRVIIGTCKKCRFFIWGFKGEKSDEHAYCGVTRGSHD